LKSTRIRIGVVGCGAIAQVAHLPVLRDLGDRFDLVALCDVDRGTLDAVGEAFHVDQRHIELGELLTDPPDVVAVLAGGDHAEAVLASLEAGCDVFVEKPLTYSLAATDEIVAAAREHERIVLVGMTKRYDPGFERAANAVRELRDLRCVDVRVLHPDNEEYLEHLRIHRGENGPRRAPERVFGREFDEQLRQAILRSQPLESLAELAGSTEPERLLTAFWLLASCIHDVNALRGVLGEPTDIVAAHGWAGGTELSAILAFGNDVRATYTWSFLPYLRHYVHRYSFLSPESRVHLDFPSPFLAAAPTVVELEAMQDGGLRRTYVTPSYESPFKRELLELHDCVVTRRPPMTDAVEARRDLEVLRAIAAALR
jgi:predicted dehydrogenase